MVMLDDSAMLSGVIRGHAAVPPVEPPEWGEPHQIVNGGWAMTAPCGCHVLPWGAEGSGVHCPAHTFADLVEGEWRLREAANGR